MYNCRIEIIDSHGGCAVIWHLVKDLEDTSMNELLRHAEIIVNALGDNWMIHSNTGDGFIKIGLKNPQTDEARKALDMPIPPTPTMADAWLTTVEVEEEYGLPKGSVRRDIHRGKFQEHEIKKIGRDWTVNMASADKLYDKRDK